MISELVWDSKFFKRKIGRLTKVPSKSECKKLIQKARKEGYKYLTARIILKKVRDIQLLEKHGFYITDIGCMWETKLNPNLQVLDFRSKVREAAIEDIPALKIMVKELFRDSRFYNDPFFKRHEADSLYQAWIKNSLRDRTSKVFITEESGFIICKKLSKIKGDIPLVGVVSKKQNKGIGTNLMLSALGWFKKTGIRTVTVRTQANNIRAMNFYKGLGFSIKYIDVTMGLILIKRHPIKVSRWKNR